MDLFYFIAVIAYIWWTLNIAFNSQTQTVLHNAYASLV